MKINKTSISDVLFETLEGGAVFLFGEDVFLTFRESLYDYEGTYGQEYNAINLETGEPQLFFGTEYVRPLNATLNV